MEATQTVENRNDKCPAATTQMRKTPSALQWAIALWGYPSTTVAILDLKQISCCHSDNRT